MLTQKFDETTAVQGEHHEIRVDALGRAIIEGKGFTGSACGLMGEALRRAIGGSKTDTDEPKPEFFASTDQSQTQSW